MSWNPTEKENGYKKKSSAYRGDQREWSLEELFQ